MRYNTILLSWCQRCVWNQTGQMSPSEHVVTWEGFFPSVKLQISENNTSGYQKICDTLISAEPSLEGVCHHNDNRFCDESCRALYLSCE